MEKGQDRMSNLPDSLLHYILSLMPLKSAVRTSILSSRWRTSWKYMWIHTATLDFGMEFAGNQTPGEFAATVSRYLQLHKGKIIERFRLFFNPGADYISDAEKWIEFTVMKGVKELDLDFVQPVYELGEGSQVTPFNLPDCFFDCQSLTHLNLSCCNFSPPLNFGGFNGLKCLKLKQVVITDEMVETLVSNCPLLVELILMECFSLGVIKISGPDLPLEFLAVIACSTYDVEIYAPNLRSFHFCGDLCYAYSFKNIPSLVDALFNSTGYEFTEPEHDYIKILSDLDHVKVLTLCVGALMYVTISEEYRPEELPITLHKLQELQLVMILLSDEYLSYIYGFLKNCICPCLEKLFIDLPSAPEIPYECEYYTKPTLVEEPSKCTLSQLKAIKINRFKGHCNEMRLLKFLLEKAFSLEKLVLVMVPTLSKKDSCAQSESTQMPLLSDLHEQLLLLPKASSGARIVLCDYSEDDNSLRPIHTDVYSK